MIGVAESPLELKLRASASTVAMNSTYMAPPKVGVRRVLLILVTVLAIPVVVIGAVVGSTMVPVVVVIVTTELSRISSHRKRRRRLRFGREFELMIDQFLMNFRQRWGRVSSFDLISDCFVLFR